MAVKVSFWILALYGTLGLITEGSAETANCDYTTESFSSTKIDVDYSCVLNTENLEYGNELTTIGGTHHDGKTDDDVKLLMTVTWELEKFTSIFCNKFKNLEVIDVSDLNIKSFDENSFENCANLNYLTISNQEITHLPENLLKEKSELKFVSIKGNEQLRSLPENFFTGQENLIELELNQLKIINPKWFANLENLESLNIGSNSISDIRSKWFENLHKLTRLGLNRNRISEVPSKGFEPLKNLKDLDLERNRIETLHPDSFYGLDNLEELDLSENNIANLPRGIFVNLRQLGRLSLSKNKLTTISSDAFGHLPQIWFINLGYNKINSIDENIITSLPGLLNLDMYRNVCTEFLTFAHTIKSDLAKCFENYN